jgi:hypothetical protein
MPKLAGDNQNMEKNAKCYRCSKAPVVWYWYGCYEDQNQLAACADHEKSLEWAMIYSFRIERARNGTIDLRETRENMYVSKGVIDRIKDKMAISFADSNNDASDFQANRSLASSHENREHLIDTIIAALPSPPVVLRSAFSNWTLAELKRFAPGEPLEKQIENTVTL